MNYTIVPETVKCDICNNIQEAGLSHCSKCGISFVPGVASKVRPTLFDQAAIEKDTKKDTPPFKDDPTGIHFMRLMSN